MTVPLLFHPLAEIFPLIEGAEFDDLVADIRQHGIREPIWIYDGQIIDGRNRYRASSVAGADCPMREYIGDDPAAFVVSLNLKRRHLNESQRAMVAAKLANIQLGGNQHSEGVAIATGSSLLNVSRDSIFRAKVVQREGAEELRRAVEQGKVSVSAAADVATKPKEEQREIVARGEKEIVAAAKAFRVAKVEQKRAVKIAETERIRENNAALPASQRKYSVIYADPPWSFQVWSGEGKDRSAENHYPTMTLAEIAALPVAKLAAEDCALFLWAVMPELPGALEVIKAWGFTYKTVAFNWVKQNKSGDGLFWGMGYWTRANSEVCLLATRGSPVRLNADVHQVVMSPVGEHSRKPDAVADRITRLVGGPRIELFARRPRDGWDVWGNEVAAQAPAASTMPIAPPAAPSDDFPDLPSFLDRRVAP
jgi:N6-adenosine-specific RNA methylase IME4